MAVRWFSRGGKPSSEMAPAAPPAASLAPPVASVPRPRLFQMVSSSGDVIHAGRDGMLVTRKGASGVPPVVLAIFPDAPESGFLFAVDDAVPAIRIANDPLAARILSYEIVRPPTAPGIVFLRHPSLRIHVCAAPAPPDADIDVCCRGEERGGWEALTLRPIADAPAPDPHSWLGAVASSTRVDDSAKGIARWLRDTRDDGLVACGEAVLRLLPPHALRDLGYEAARDPGLRARLAVIFPGNPWTDGALAELGAWLADRPRAAVRRIDHDRDFLVADCTHARGRASPAATLAIAARARVEPRHELAVLATARNEGIYFLEWIAHYRALGADHFFIYSNDNDDGSDALLRALAEAGEITWTDNRFAPGVDGQLKAYAHHLAWAPEGLDYRWTLIVDLDEFVLLDTGRYRNLAEFLRLRGEQGATAVAMSWMVFTPSGQLAWDGVPMIGRYDRREPHDNTAVKTACQTRYYLASYPHDPFPSPGAPHDFRGAAGAPHHWRGRDQLPSNGPPLYEHAWVAHYYFKSVEEYLWKKSRSPGGFAVAALEPRPEALTPHLHWSAHEAPRDERGRRHLAGLEAELARLRLLPGVAAAEASVASLYRERVSRLVADSIARITADPASIPHGEGILRLLEAARTARG